MPTDIQQRAVEIHEQFVDDLNITVEDVNERLETLVEDYSVPLDEASHSVRSDYLDRAGLEYEAVAGGTANDEPAIATIAEANQWIDLTAKVVELWEPNHESIAQIGLLGDESGRSSSFPGRPPISQLSSRILCTGLKILSPMSTRAGSR